ncbi:MAG: hypothetical protein JOZ54_07280 [Acidobacteria bacterium]|nr:hypothetical protein [Acidobacteriota bacterium]
MTRKVVFAITAILCVVAASQSVFAMPGGGPLNNDPLFSPGTTGGCPQMVIFDCVNGRSRNCYLESSDYNPDGTINCRYSCEYVHCSTA